MVASKKIYSEAEIREHMQAWLTLVKERQEEVIKAYRNLVTLTKKNIIEDIKQSHSKKELEKILEEYIDENRLDATWDALDMDRYLNISAIKLLKEELGNDYYSYYNCKILKWADIAEKYNTSSFYHDFLNRRRELVLNNFKQNINKYKNISLKGYY